MKDKFKECDDDCVLDLKMRSSDENTRLWKDELDKFKNLIKFSDPEKEKCFKCKESIVSWNGDYLFCAKKGIILKYLK